MKTVLVLLVSVLVPKDDRRCDRHFLCTMPRLGYSICSQSGLWGSSSLLTAHAHSRLYYEILEFEMKIY